MQPVPWMSLNAHQTRPAIVLIGQRVPGQQGEAGMSRKIIPDVIRGQRVAFVKEEATVREVANLMRKQNVGAVPIVEDGTLKGILTVNDMTYRVIAEGRDPDTTPVRGVMTRNPDTAGCDTTAIDALRLMQDGGYRHLPVMDGGRIVGLVSRRDFYGVEKARLDDETSLWERIA
jgi:CBS domain-containing protein